jgi:OOP family OmpA-OmpF porin
VLSSKKSVVRLPIVAVVTVLALLSTGCSTLGKGPFDVPEKSAQFSDTNKWTSPDWYVSSGVGVSRMNPDTGNVDGVSVDDPIDTGVQLSIGSDLSRHLSLEVHTSDLGSSELSTGGEVGYRVHGASALWYAGDRAKRNGTIGLNGYGRLGVGVLENSVSGSVGYEQENQAQMLVGAGVEYGTRSGLGLRAEVVAFEQSVQYGQVGLIYRFGAKTTTQHRGEIAQTSEEPTETSAKNLSLVTARQVETKDKEPQLSAAGENCQAMTGERVYFDTNSFRLDDKQKQSLDLVIETLSLCQQSRVEIVGHADSTGTAQWNETLSKKRATAVMVYMKDQGLSQGRQSIKALGESAPSSSNQTREGREKNRRVELVIR